MISIRLFGFARLVLFMTACVLWTAARSPARASVCTLADLIRSANSNTAVGFCPAGTSHEIITITEDITLSRADATRSTGTITIEGGGHTISGDGKFPIFYVKGGQLTVNNLTLTKGNSIGYRRGFGGSAIGIDGGALAVNKTSFVGNSGSAVVIWRSTGEINSSSFVANRSGTSGAAIFVGQGVTLDVSNSTFSHNLAPSGGSALATNVTTFRGIIPSRVTLTHVTIVPRPGIGRGKGLNILIDENDKNFKVRNSLIVGVKGQYLVEGSSCLGPLKQNIGNFIEDGSCASMAGGDPMLAKMPSAPAYFDLLDGSPALDTADPKYCTETDQLGTPRPQGEGCDVGAIESTTALPAPAPVVPPPPCPLDLRVTAANTDAPAGGCPAGSGHDVITLTADINLDEPLPPITSEITIEGSGYTISATERFRVFYVAGPAAALPDACTLADPIIAANTDAPAGACPAEDGADVIRLRKDIMLDAPLPSITSDIAFDGMGHTISGDNRFRIFDIASGNVVFKRIPLADGRNLGEHPAGFGGAITLRNSADLILYDATFRNNKARMGGAVATIDASHLFAFESRFLDNEASDKGGAILRDGVCGFIHYVDFRRNIAGDLQGSDMDDLWTHIEGGAGACTSDPETYTLSDS